MSGTLPHELGGNRTPSSEGAKQRGGRSTATITTSNGNDRDDNDDVTQAFQAHRLGLVLAVNNARWLTREETHDVVNEIVYFVVRKLQHTIYHH